MWKFLRRKPDQRRSPLQKYAKRLRKRLKKQVCRSKSLSDNRMLFECSSAQTEGLK